MDFYEKKKEAYNLIDQMFNDKAPVNIIQYKVATKFGFGKKIVNERIEALKTISQMMKNKRGF